MLGLFLVLEKTRAKAEKFPVFDRLEGMSAVRALEFKRGSYLFAIDKSLAADLTLKLAAAAGIIVDVLMWCTA